nr:hypothetical protein BaRGS_010760 [Batillaria attramentaria]
MVLLSTPNVENAVNMEAIQMMSEAPHAYRQLVLECVNASQRINVLNLLEENPKLQKVHMALPREELEEQMKRQMEE